MEKVFDEKDKPQIFLEGDLVLLWDKRHKYLGKHKKFDRLWLGPYVIKEMCDQIPNYLCLGDLEGQWFNFHINGKHVKHFIHP
jgi:hypothetical protein